MSLNRGARLRVLSVAGEEIGLRAGGVGGSEWIGSVVLHRFVGDNIITVMDFDYSKTI